MAPDAHPRKCCYSVGYKRGVAGVESGPQVFIMADIEESFLGEFMYAQKWVKSKKRKTEKWGVYSTSSLALLGVVSWFAAWRQYTFRPNKATTFNSSCLGEIVKFLDRVNQEHRENNKKSKKGLTRT